MPKYVDGYVVPIPKDKLEAYRAVAEVSAKVWREYGALEYRECIAEDVKPGTLTSFPRSVLLEPNEVVIFAYIVFKSRQERDAINEQVMKDPRITSLDCSFDGKRIVFGGFETLVGD